MSRRFVNTYHQKVDGKGRVSVPSSFRRVLELGDPDWKPGDRANFYINHGLDYQRRLDCYTIRAMEEIYDRIDLMEDGTDDRIEMEATFHSNSMIAEIDKDGRIIIPLELREKLGLEPDEVAKFVGRNTIFQIWKEETYQQAIGALNDRLTAGRSANYDPRVKLPSKSQPAPPED